MGSFNAFVSTAAQVAVSGVAEGAVGRYKVVKLGTADQQVIQAGAGESGFGIAQDGVADTKEVSVVIAGTSFAIAAGVIAKDAWVKPAADGKVATASTNKDVTIGRALSAAGADGDRIPIEVTKIVLNV